MTNNELPEGFKSVILNYLNKRRPEAQEIVNVKRAYDPGCGCDTCGSPATVETVIAYRISPGGLVFNYSVGMDEMPDLWDYVVRMWDR